MTTSAPRPTTEQSTSSAARIASAAEAVLLTSDKPVAPAKLLEALATIGLPCDPKALESAIGSLNAEYESSSRSFRIERVAGGWRTMAVDSAAPVLAAFHGAKASSRLSRAALETLAIVAYRQPVTRAEIESIRGVAAGEVLRSLMDRRLITIAGRADELGRPMLYGTSKDFLSVFGLASLSELPEMEGTRPASSPDVAEARTHDAETSENRR